MPAPNSKPPKKEVNWGRLSKTLSFWILILLIPVALIQLSGARGDSAPEIRYDQYRAELARGNVSEVTIQAGKSVTGTFREPITVSNKPAKKFTAQLGVKDSPEE